MGVRPGRKKEFQHLVESSRMERFIQLYLVYSYCLNCHLKGLYNKSKSKTSVQIQYRFESTLKLEAVIKGPHTPGFSGLHTHLCKVRARDNCKPIFLRLYPFCRRFTTSMHQSTWLCPRRLPWLWHYQRQRKTQTIWTEGRTELELLNNKSGSFTVKVETMYSAEIMGNLGIEENDSSLGGGEIVIILFLVSYSSEGQLRSWGGSQAWSRLAR